MSQHKEAMTVPFNLLLLSWAPCQGFQEVGSLELFSVSRKMNISLKTKLPLLHCAPLEYGADVWFWNTNARQTSIAGDTTSLGMFKNTASQDKPQNAIRKCSKKFLSKWFIIEILYVTACSRVVTEKLKVTQLVKIFHLFYNSKVQYWAHNRLELHSMKGMLE